MSTIPGSDWRKEFGLDDRTAPAFFPSAASLDTLTADVPQAHALRRAFEMLGLSGILCQNNAAVVYFKEVDQLVPEQVTDLQRRFWNQGLSPLLVLIAPTEVRVYSSLTAPPRGGEPPEGSDRLVARLNRAADAAEIRQFALSVESGEVFRSRPKSFDPAKRVDRALLRNLSAAREQMASTRLVRDVKVLDNILCRVVFTCYLFDRKVIDAEYLEKAGVAGTRDLREILARKRGVAVAQMYDLFRQLGEDFNGDLFIGDLAAEAEQVSASDVLVLSRLLDGTDMTNGQRSFWPYDFSVIPIETISSIYEQFLKATDADQKKKKGAFYTPRFLAELVLDMALAGEGRLLGRRFMDPACGSGIFLVGLFNRLAEEWSRANEGATYTARANGLLAILKTNLLGVDENPTACRIAAFGLYLALLDQLKPSHIQELQKKKKFLPRLVFSADEPSRKGVIFCGDFFALPTAIDSERVDIVVGNPPWASVAGPVTPAERWCEERDFPIANRQLALAFVWKAAHHLTKGGRACFVLPSGVLFNHQALAINAQRAWFSRHTVESVLNLSDYQRFLFSEAEFPALVIRYRPTPSEVKSHRVEYLAPKTDWAVSRAEVVSIAPEDRTDVPVNELLADLKDESAPLPWKVRFWGSPRDRKLLDRLALFPRLGDLVGQARKRPVKRWTAVQGFQPVGESDDPEQARTIEVPTDLFISAKSKALDLVLLEGDCSRLESRTVKVRAGSNTNTTGFLAPHVLVSHGVRVAYADFPVAFQHALQGIHGPAEDGALLKFLAAYLTSPLARFFLFHTTSSWGVSKAKVHLEELLKLPFPLPEETLDPARGRSVVAEAAAVMDKAAAKVGRREFGADREKVVEQVRAKLHPLVFEYFDIDQKERVLVEDTNKVIIPSTRPTKASYNFPALLEPTLRARSEYVSLLCGTLNSWSARSKVRVTGRTLASSRSGVGAVELHKGNGVLREAPANAADNELLAVLDRLRKAYRRQLGSVELLRGVKVFDQNTLYIFKPLRQRFWTRSAALNDADSIAASILATGGGGVRP